MILSPVSDADLDRAFAALADPIRRRIIARLSRGSATVNELAEPFEISKQAVSKHIQVLELAELCTPTRGRVRSPRRGSRSTSKYSSWLDWSRARVTRSAGPCT